MKSWVVSAKKADFNGLAKKYNISPMLARVLRNRDIQEEDYENFLNPSLNNLHAPNLLPDIDKAAKVITDAIKGKKNIEIIGDYDIDGVCASYILKKGLSYLGNEAVIRLPDRVKDGYGMNMNMIDEAVKKNIDLIITCDNGIAAYDEIEYAKSKGITVVVTDHHEVPFSEINGNRQYRIPDCAAVVDPKRADSLYPYSGICGGMVAFKLIQYMCNESIENSTLLKELLMFAAFATVGDVMDLLDENRIVVKFGLELMGKSNNIGINALIDVNGLERNALSPYHLGFILGPCINATGRLDTADRAFALFDSEDYKQALDLAIELKNLNDSRKDMTVYFTKLALEMIEKDEKLHNSRVLVIYLPDCHESLAGIIAGRIKEIYYRPVFVLTKGDTYVKGSGRSIEKYDMYYEMTKCSDLFVKYGGHTMAAGLSMEEAKVDEFRNRINEYCSLEASDMIEKVVIDIPMPIKYASLDLAEEFKRLEPYGTGNRKPIFAEKDITIKNFKVYGKNRNVCKMKLISSDSEHSEKTAILFGDGDELEPVFTDNTTKAVLYELSINEFMGSKNIELIIKDYK